MAFVKLISKGNKEWQGESFSKPLTKGNGSIWLAEDTGYHELLNAAGSIVSTAALSHSVDDLALIFFVPLSDTATLEGKHRLLIHLTNTANIELDDVIAEYEILYSIKKA